MVPSIYWPAIPGPDAAQVLALEFQLERTQWLPTVELESLQLRQMESILRHAYETVPYYRQRWYGLWQPGQSLSRQDVARLPLISRRDLLENVDALKSRAMPEAHGAVAESRTSGSTGRPVRTFKTALSHLYWRALGLRDHFWHQRDFAGKLAAIRQGVRYGEYPGWGAVTEGVIATGPSVTLDIMSSIDVQLQWLQTQQPDYLLSYPSNIAELARQSSRHGIRLSRLREVRAIGEVLGDEVRDLCLKSWGVPVTDIYSTDEVGYVAIQCPESSHYHVQAENLFVEVLDENDMACAPGAVGRVVVTTLNNFAMPLVRYDIGDYAEVGAACPCGRGLPVLRRIMGRVRNMLRLADGGAYWPMLGTHSFAEMAPVVQHQFVQKRYDYVELRLVVSRALLPGEQAVLYRHVMSRLPQGVGLGIVCCTEIPRSAGGKFEDFVSEIS